MGLSAIDAKNEDLEGLTLEVYLYVVKKGKPVGHVQKRRQGRGQAGLRTHIKSSGQMGQGDKGI